VSSTLSSELSARPAHPIRGNSAVLWLAAGTLLVGEYLLTSYAVNIRHLAVRGDWLATLGSAGSLGPIAFAIATATLLLGGRPLLEELRLALGTATHAQGSLVRRLGLVAVHLASFAAFFWLTQLLSRTLDAPPSYTLALAVGLLASALAAPLALAQALLPLGALLPILRRVGRALLLGTALGMAAWAGGVATLHFWEPLGAATLHATAWLLRLAGPDVWSDAATATLGFEGFTVVISRSCSGYEGIGLLTILTGAYLWAFRSALRFPQVLVLVPIGIALSWLANVLRIAALMLVGARWSLDLALGSFHSKAGWLLFCGIALGLVALTRRTPLFSRDVAARSPVATWNPTAAYLMPLLALVGVHMATGLFTTGLPLLYPLGILAGAAMLWRHRADYPWLFRLQWSWEAAALGVAAFVLWIALEPAADPTASAAWREELAALPVPLAALWLAFRVLGSVIVVPVAEELAFRGYLLRRLFSADFTSIAFSRFGWASLLVSSAAYGLLHERWLAGILAGMVFAFAQYRRGRLTDAVLAHAVTNLLVAVHAIGWQRWSF
jgi:exosortase E/protease (VPEID-CTERM system)